MNFDAMFASPGGRTSRAHFVPALVTLLAVFAFYTFIVKGRTAQWCMVVLLWPAFVLHARRLHDMGRSAWLLLAPLALLLCSFAIRLELFQFVETWEKAVRMTAAAASAVLILWCCSAGGRTTARQAIPS